jgi:drug/metabolite transporter (DMT)-like permease
VRRPSGRNVGLVLIALSAICFGAMPIFARGAYAAGVDPNTLLLLRFAIAGGVLWVLVLFRGAPRPRGRTLAWLALMGGVYVAQSLAYFTALTMTSAALLSLLLYLYPILVAVLAAVVLKVPLTRTKQALLLVAVLGAALTVGPVSGGGNALGIGLGIGASLIYACYILALTRLAPRAEALPSSAVISTAAALVFLGLALVRGTALPVTPLGWAAVLAIALVSTVVAILAFVGGLARIGPTDTATISSLEPVVTLSLAAALLGETLAPLQLVGGAFILVAVIRLARYRSDEPAALLART